jgi:hypothetical protein
MQRKIGRERKYSMTRACETRWSSAGDASVQLNTIADAARLVERGRVGGLEAACPSPAVTYQ